MKPISNKKYLAAEQDGYACYMLPVNEETLELAGFLRGLHKERLHNSGYEGYSEAFDNNYHLGGIYFYVETQGIVATTLRMNMRSDDLIFPFEMGLLDNGMQHEYTGLDLAVDVNTYCLYKRFYKKATWLLFLWLQTISLKWELSGCLVCMILKIGQ